MKVTVMTTEELYKFSYDLIGFRNKVLKLSLFSSISLDPPFPKGGKRGFSLSFVSPCDMNVSYKKMTPHSALANRRNARKKAE
ncbi:MAG: hypothetical protein COX52_08235 [Syntrophobacterales bacterium CG23_combo_of_CG06-09_8_20_14_all_48_27]|nr:MAG: hypothetical protein COX52_08235 [Syntrophobacterales bacterium CG23_combo_of_CG06-09_8_20_14_all_48_27]